MVKGFYMTHVKRKGTCDVFKELKTQSILMQIVVRKHCVCRPRSRKYNLMHHTWVHIADI